MKHILKAYNGDDGINAYFTFKATVRNIRECPGDEDIVRFFEFDVDYDYFEQKYMNDEFVYGDGTKRWEMAYIKFNGYEYMIIPSNLRLIKDSGGYDLLTVGTEVIISANDYYCWVGWQYPILSLSIDGTTYLDFETGKENYLNYVRAGFKDV